MNGRLSSSFPKDKPFPEVFQQPTCLWLPYFTCHISPEGAWDRKYFAVYHGIINFNAGNGVFLNCPLRANGAYKLQAGSTALKFKICRMAWTTQHLSFVLYSLPLVSSVRPRRCHLFYCRVPAAPLPPANCHRRSVGLSLGNQTYHFQTIEHEKNIGRRRHRAK